ncbi:unnamed protein product [Protopolystoma xenopodis]|uniref:Uncharacterized protein n=1 Tax=Protopolystoma xenopodis TaxID=117903 RepID=A0A3S5ATS4_9PLAT|nr:unnamed protein product [Protopolystoma xenopodis]
MPDYTDSHCSKNKDQHSGDVNTPTRRSSSHSTTPVSLTKSRFYRGWRYFRLIAIGPNSHGTGEFALGGVDFYGQVISTHKTVCNLIFALFILYFFRLFFLQIRRETGFR